MSANVLFLLAHQDDELGMATRIAFERRRGSRVICLFVTDGGRSVSDQRNRESRAVLESFGVARQDTHFLGSEEGVSDGTLVQYLPAVLESLQRRLRGLDLQTIYCLAWEGGHQDHDATHLLGRALAVARNTPLVEMPFYHGRGLPGSLFRLFAPLGEGWESRGVRRAEALQVVALTARYRSQWRTWLGFLPVMLAKALFVSREHTRRVDPRSPLERPHRGPLLYERRFKVPFPEFWRDASPFIETSIVEPPGEGSGPVSDVRSTS